MPSSRVILEAADCVVVPRDLYLDLQHKIDITRFIVLDNSSI
jgi:hypothetical protein